MAENTKKPNTKSLRRYSAVSQVLQLIEEGMPLSHALDACARRNYDGCHYSASTLEKWYYRYKHLGYEGLYDLPRKDRGKSQVLTLSMREQLRKLRLQYPRLSVKSLLRHLEAEGIFEAGSYSLSSVYRYLREHQLDARSLRAGLHPEGGGPTKAFEKALPNQLWMSDAMHGIGLKTHAGKTRKTYLIGIIDDYSRLIVHAQYYFQEQSWCLMDSFKQAIKRRGIPDAFYTDNGKIFTSAHMKEVCAHLKINLLHAKPYAAYSKGKIERFFLTVQKDFEQSLVFKPVSELLQLNQRLWRWLEQDYHRRPHSALQGKSPAERFHAENTQLRFVEENKKLDQHFLKTIQRKVRQDCTISINNELWEVPVILRGQSIQLRLDPQGNSPIEIWHKDHYHGQATRCDKQLNAHHFNSRNYDC
ncbi:MAG: DDE-type integrase/transposase/recombinase [Nitrospinaceae bacterium]|jgi:transposase InsO family protein|nr:DDE-type integrase/transposase/recombinase [Nitrospinaceae bacterium]|tara:strand:+ start:867 stop:2117 length:1251 start_codon:yes stop_codon:yes gene_type:complete